MKATLEFDLGDTPNRTDFLRAVKSLDMAICLWEFNQKLFRMEDLDEGTMEEVKKAWFTTLEENDIIIDKLID